MDEPTPLLDFDEIEVIDGDEVLDPDLFPDDDEDAEVHLGLIENGGQPIDLEEYERELAKERAKT